jgi:hypothetical protein
MSRRIDGLPYAPAHTNVISESRVTAVWNEIRVTDDIGVADREVIDALEREVTDCLVQEPPDIGRAISLTAKALALIAGLNDL